MGEVMARVRARLPADAIFTNGAGNFSVWTHRFYEFREYRTQLAPTSGAMGYGVPAAVAAKLLHPERLVVACGQRRLSDDRTGARDRGAARCRDRRARRQQRHVRDDQDASGAALPGSRPGTDLVNPDFAALARAFGAHGSVVERTDEFEAAFDAAIASERPAVIELRVDTEALTPRQTLSEIREAAQARLESS